MAKRLTKVGGGLVLALVLVAGCGGDDGGDEGEDASSSAPTEETPEETTEDTTDVTVEVVEPEDTGDAGSAATEDELTSCLTDLGHTVEEDSGFGSDYALLVDDGVVAGGAEVYGYEDPAAVEEAAADVQGAYPSSAVEIAGQVTFAYSPEQIEVAGDVAECAEP